MNMILYFLFFLIMLLIASFDLFSLPLNTRSKVYLVGVASIILICVAGFRWFDVPLVTFDGTWQIFDYSAYEYAYNNPLSLGINFFTDLAYSNVYIKSMDPGYIYISSFFSHYVVNDANIFFLILSIVTIILFVSGLKRNQITNYLFIILFIYFCRLYFQYNFIMMRQAISMSIAWWAIPYILNHKFKQFAICCLIAGLFHFTGFLFLVVYWLPKFKFKNKLLMWLLPTLFILGITGLTTEIILSTLKVLLGTIGMEDKVAAYLLNDTYSRGVNPLNFIELSPFLYCGVRYRKEICETKNGQFFFNLLILYAIFMLLTMNFMAFTRISSYYLYSFLYITAFGLGKIKIPIHRGAVGYLLCLYFLFYGLRFVSSNFSALGYHFFFIQ